MSSCRREPPSNVDRNKAPETYVTRAPAESSLAYYRVHFYWTGGDPDGDIAYYEIAVTDSNEVPGQDLEEGTGYTRTHSTDSLFIMAADPPITQQILGKRFYVRAVDNEGKLDPTPALAYFVAKNDCYPQVLFHGGSGAWTDKCDNPLVRLFNGVTDTVGAGTCARWTWGGSDCDAFGFIKGYKWKMSSQTAYRGGTLADTLAEVCFPLNASRRQILQVRAIDDGGLESIDDFTQTVIVNFDPITLIVHPTETTPEGLPKRAAFFRDRVNSIDYPSGTTLPDDDTYQVEVRYTGYDDPRDSQGACNEPGVHRYQTRILFREDSFGTPGGSPFRELNNNLPYPDVNIAEYNGLGSGDHFILIRAQDDNLVVDSTPETVLVKVNYPPYMIKLEAHPDGRPAIDLLNIRNTSPSNPIDIQLAENETLLVVAKGRDLHFVNPANDPEGLAALYDSSHVVGDETGLLDVFNGYRVFIDSAIVPGYEPIPGFNPANDFEAELLFPQPGIYAIVADVKDKTNSNPEGRRGRIVRYIRIVR